MAQRQQQQDDQQPRQPAASPSSSSQGGRSTSRRRRSSPPVPLLLIAAALGVLLAPPLPAVRAWLPPSSTRTPTTMMISSSSSSSTPAASSSSSPSSPTAPSGAGAPRIGNKAPPPVAVQQVFICTNRWCMQRGAGATMGSFIGLTPFGSKLRVQGVDCLGRCNKGPHIRILRSNGSFEELSYIDSVDKVYDVFTTNLGISLNQSAADWYVRACVGLCIGAFAGMIALCWTCPTHECATANTANPPQFIQMAELFKVHKRTADGGPSFLTLHK